MTMRLNGTAHNGTATENGVLATKLHQHWSPSMRKLPIAVAALALMTGAAAAQTSTSPSSPARAPGAATTAPMHKTAAINPLTQEDVSKIEGTSVYGNNDDQIGHISTI